MASWRETPSAMSARALFRNLRHGEMACRMRFDARIGAGGEIAHILPAHRQFARDGAHLDAMFSREPAYFSAQCVFAQRAETPINIRPRRVFVGGGGRSEEHTSELQSLMRISYAVFCLKKKQKRNK